MGDPEGSISFDSFDFRRIRRYDVTTKTITIEFYIIQRRVLAALGRPPLLVLLILHQVRDTRDDVSRSERLMDRFHILFMLRSGVCWKRPFVLLWKLWIGNRTLWIFNNPVTILFFLLLPSFTGFSTGITGFSTGITGFSWVVSGFCWVVSGFTGFLCFFTGFLWIFLG